MADWLPAGRVGPPARAGRQLPRDAPARGAAERRRRGPDRRARVRASCAAPAPTSARSCASRASTAARRSRRCAAPICSCPREQAPALGEQEFWAEELEGCAVVRRRRERRARARAARTALLRGAGRRSRGGGELLVPMVARRDPLGRRRRAAHRRRPRRSSVRARLRPAVVRTSSRRRATIGKDEAVQIDVVTLFPQWFDWFVSASVTSPTRWQRAASCACSTRVTTRRSAAARSTTRRSAAAPGWSCAST